jgi:hypothetical protein
MSRKKSHPTPQETSELALSSFHARFEQLEEDRQWLLKQIKRKQTELRNFLEQMRSLLRLLNAASRFIKNWYNSIEKYMAYLRKFSPPASLAKIVGKN